jgi:outer membrane protein assembly factor BamB
MKKFILIISFLSFIVSNTNSQQILGWRGLDRTGVYNETGLLKSWPAEGPEMIWINENLPDGHSSVAIAGNSIYLTGIVDSMDVLISLGMDGKQNWQIPYGRAWMQSFPESRCTPTIEENRIYVSSGMGDIACIDATSGKIFWKLKAATEFDAEYKDWGVAENLLLKGNMLFFSPIGKQTTTISLDKLTGKLIWKSESIDDAMAYVSPILINYGGKDIIINISARFVYAVNAENGKILWKFNHSELMKPTEDWAPVIKCTTPLYSEGKIFITGGYDHVGALLKMNDDASGVEVVWADRTLDNHHGGVLKLGDYIYGSNWVNNGTGNWCCIEWKTGKVMYETKWICKGSIIANDGMLYCYDEKAGNLGLVKATPEKFDLVSSFKIKAGKGPYWSHPVIKDGVLYVRHGKALMAYSIKSK